MPCPPTSLAEPGAPLRPGKPSVVERADARPFAGPAGVSEAHAACSPGRKRTLAQGHAHARGSR
eukprot:8534090-Alexandrium_andersonii.AAC.1